MPGPIYGSMLRRREEKRMETAGGRQTAKNYLAQIIRQQEQKLVGLKALEDLLQASELNPEDDLALWSLFCSMTLR